LISAHAAPHRQSRNDNRPRLLSASNASKATPVKRHATELIDSPAKRCDTTAKHYAREISTGIVILISRLIRGARMI
jgi:hypothetical protein